MKNSTRWKENLAEYRDICFHSNGLCFLTAVKEFLLDDFVAFILLQFYLFYNVVLVLLVGKTGKLLLCCCLQNKTLEQPFKKLRNEVHSKHDALLQ